MNPLAQCSIALLEAHFEDLQVGPPSTVSFYFIDWQRSQAYCFAQLGTPRGPSLGWWFRSCPVLDGYTQFFAIHRERGSPLRIRPIDITEVPEVVRFTPFGLMQEVRRFKPHRYSHLPPARDAPR